MLKKGEVAVRLTFCITTLGGHFLRGGPGVGLAGFEKGEDGHEEGEGDESAVAENRIDREGLGSGKGAAVKLQGQSVRTHDGGEESEDDHGDESGPDAQANTEEQQQAENDFRERQCVRNKIHAQSWENLIRINLQRKKRKGDSHRRAALSIPQHVCETPLSVDGGCV